MSFRTVSGGLIRVTGTAALYCGLWMLCIARKPSQCHLSLRRIAKGDAVYRPITNSRERADRVLADVMERRAEADDRLFSRATPASEV